MGLMVREGRTYDFTDEIHLLTPPLNVSYKVTESILSIVHCHVIIPVYLRCNGLNPL